MTTASTSRSSRRKTSTTWSESPPPLPSLDEIRAEKVRRSLREYVPQAWPIVEASRPFVSNWHIDAVCDYLQAVSNGEIRRLIINIPPRHMKSLAAAVFWPTWDWIDHPERQWLYISYSEKLSKRDSLKSRRIIEAQGGREEGGSLIERYGYRGLLGMMGKDLHLTTDQNEKMRFENSETGYRIASSIGGTATGEGGDILVLDDPHKADEAESSSTSRETVTDFIDGTLSTRFNNPKTGALVVVMQRLHEEDATGHLLDRGGFEHLCLPARFEPSHPFIWPDDPRTEPEQVLWEGHFDEPELEELSKEMTTQRAAGQLQQLPSPAKGGIFKADWWRFYTPLKHPLSQVLKTEASWDMAFKRKEDSDYVVGQLWGAQGVDRWLIAMIRARLSYTESKKAIKALAGWARLHGFPSHRKLVEDKANGSAILDDLRHSVSGLVAVEPEGGKVARANAVTHQIEAGNVHLPEGVIPCPPSPHRADGTPLWTPTSTDDFIEEHKGFPYAAHDDMVDALTQYLIRSKGASLADVIQNPAKEDASLASELLDERAW